MTMLMELLTVTGFFGWENLTEYLPSDRSRACPLVAEPCFVGESDWTSLLLLLKLDLRADLATGSRAEA